MVGPGRVELPTSRLSGVRSNHLSYEPLRGYPQKSQGFRPPAPESQILINNIWLSIGIELRPMRPKPLLRLLIWGK